MNILLKTIEKGDLPILMDWINSESKEYFLQWGGAGAGFNFPLDLLQLEQHFNLSLQIFPTRKLFKALKGETMVGYIELNKINREHNSAVISRVIVNKKFEGLGVGQQMVDNWNGFS